MGTGLGKAGCRTSSAFDGAAKNYDRDFADTRLGRALGIPTPTHDFIYAALLPQERKARGLV